jgi:hypothetical protein
MDSLKANGKSFDHGINICRGTSADCVIAEHFRFFVECDLGRTSGMASRIDHPDGPWSDQPAAPRIAG